MVRRKFKDRWPEHGLFSFVGSSAVAASGPGWETLEKPPALGPEPSPVVAFGVHHKHLPVEIEQRMSDAIALRGRPAGNRLLKKLAILGSFCQNVLRYELYYFIILFIRVFISSNARTESAFHTVEVP